MNKLKIYVVDDTSSYRDLFIKTLKRLDYCRYIGEACDGASACMKIKLWKPDIALIDTEMPGMTGKEILENLKKNCPDVKVIMVSAYNPYGANHTMKALFQGAFGFVTKPDDPDQSKSIDSFFKELAPLLNSIKKEGLQFRSVLPVRPAVSGKPNVLKNANIVAIGISTGGPEALAKILPVFPKDFPIPIVIVQHLPPLFTETLIYSLTLKCKATLIEGKNGVLLEAGKIYIAPGGKQMAVVSKNNAVEISITDDPPENFCKPSVDYLFRSIASVYGEKVISVIMTGMGEDGATHIQHPK